MTQDQHRDLAQRIVHLERTQRLYRIGVLFLAVLGFALFLVAKRPAARVQEASAFVLVDDQGNSRAQLALSETGDVSLLLRTAAGAADAGFVVRQDGTTAFRLKNPKRSATLELALNGAARLRFNQAFSKTTVEFGIDKGGKPRLLMSNATGKVVHHAPSPK